jgi:hypothetical protein
MMKKMILILSLVASMAMGQMVQAVCCTSINTVTAWAPEFNKVGCTRSAKVSYGGTGDVRCDATNLYMTTVTQTSKLYVVVTGMGDALAASNVVGRDVNCNAGTTLAKWTPTAGCAVLTGQRCYSRYEVKTTACATSPAQTVTSDSAAVVCP